jgi:DNA-binding response OmpR family regulator
MKVLLAEDDAASRALLKQNLEELGHEVTVAQDGEEAWELFMLRNCSVVVSDWLMPRLDGVGLCQRIRLHQTNHYIYFILQTARSGKGDYYQAMREGVDDFLPKPVDMQELMIRLKVAERIISYKSQIRQLRALLPICMYCKKVRNDKEYWQQVETYFHEVTGADFSHGVCPACYDTILVPEVNRKPGLPGLVERILGKNPPPPPVPRS